MSFCRTLDQLPQSSPSRQFGDVLVRGADAAHAAHAAVSKQTGILWSSDFKSMGAAKETFRQREMSFHEPSCRSGLEGDVPESACQPQLRARE